MEMKSWSLAFYLTILITLLVVIGEFYLASLFQKNFHQQKIRCLFAVVVSLASLFLFAHDFDHSVELHVDPMPDILALLLALERFEHSGELVLVDQMALQKQRRFHLIKDVCEGGCDKEGLLGGQEAPFKPAFQYI